MSFTHTSGFVRISGHDRAIKIITNVTFVSITHSLPCVTRARAISRADEKLPYFSFTSTFPLSISPRPGARTFCRRELYHPAQINFYNFIYLPTHARDSSRRLLSRGCVLAADIIIKNIHNIPFQLHHS